MMKIGDIDLDLSSPAVMTIINVTPDSFFPGSRTMGEEDIVRRVEEAVEQGAAILDIGGYSSRPGADEVTEQEESDRIYRALEIIRRRHPGIPVSLDTFRSGVASGAMERFGECIINDISAGALDEQIMNVAAHFGVPYIAMHMRGTPADMQNYTEYEDITVDVEDYFRKKLLMLKLRGVEQVILDPGFGFSKTTWQNYELMEGMDKLLVFGLPLLAGISRKSMIYKVLEKGPEDALTGTSALNWECLCKGASILRVHDTREASDIIKLYNYYKG